MATDFLYIAADMRTHEIIAELPLIGVEFGSVFKGVGELQGSVPLGDPDWNSVTVPDDVRGLVFAGAAGELVSTPTPDPITGDLTIIVEATLADWTPAGNQTLLSMYNAAPNIGWRLVVLSAGTLRFTWSADGTAVTSATSTVVTGLADGARRFIRMIFDVNNGAAQNTVTFSTSPDATTWTPLGAVVVTAGVTSMFATPADLLIGSDTGGTNNQLIGTVWQAHVYSGTVEVASFDPLVKPARLALVDLTWQDAQLNTWTRTAAVPFTGNAGATYTIDKANFFNGSQSDRNAIFVDFGGTLVWGGPIWTRRYNSDDRMLEISAREWPSYYQRQFIDQTLKFAAGLDGTADLENADQLAIARYLIQFITDQAGGDVLTELGAELSGVTRDRTYFWYEYKEVWEAILQLSRVIDGFDVAFDVFWDNGVPAQKLTLSYPRRGRLAGATEVVLDYPGNIVHYEWPEDGDRMATRVHALGAGEGDSAIRASRSKQQLIDNGYPLLQEVYTYTDIIEQATLDNHAEADLAALQEPFTAPTVTLAASRDPIFGTYITGDDAMLQIVDERFPAGLNTSMRILGWKVHPEEYLVDLDIGTLTSLADERQVDQA